MARIRLSRKAIADLDGIWDYTAQTWSEEQAVIYYRQIYGAIQGLIICLFPVKRDMMS